MIRAHVLAIRGLLEGAGLDVSEGYPTDAAGVPIVLPERPYVIVLHDDGASTRNFEAESERRSFVFQTTTVGDTDHSVQLMNDLVFTALLDVVPAVEGRSCWPIEHLDTDATRPDTDSRPPVFVGVNRWGVQSVPA